VTGHSAADTRPGSGTASEDLWYLAYVDPDHNLAMIQASVDHSPERTRSLRNCDVRVSRHETGALPDASRATGVSRSRSGAAHQAPERSLTGMSRTAASYSSGVLRLRSV
jgi:hypothetical protein